MDIETIFQEIEQQQQTTEKEVMVLEKENCVSKDA